MSKPKEEKTTEETDVSLCCCFGVTPGHPCRICRGSALTFTNGMSTAKRRHYNDQALYSQMVNARPRTTDDQEKEPKP